MTTQTVVDGAKRLAMLGAAGCLAALSCLVLAGASVRPAAAASLAAPVVGIASTPDGGGYWEVASDGGVFAFGDAQFYGSMGGHALNAPIVGIAATPDGNGYWEVASDGGIFAFGDANFYGSMGGKPLNQPIVGIAATPDGAGYWEVASDGGIFAFGDAAFYGSMGGQPLNQPIVGMAPDAQTGGYWEVASDGGIFAFNAPFYGSMGGKPLDKPVVAMSATANGYMFAASDGGIFNFGSSQFYGSMGGKPLNQPIVGVATTPDGGGYWDVASDGGVFAFGNAQFYGSAQSVGLSTVTGSTTGTSGNVQLAVHLDPSFVQSASNPLSVVYTASASATLKTVTGTASTSTTATSLPSGILNFYSDGTLACSTNVGGSTTTTDCPITYSTLGQHTVITEYISGTSSATETDQEEISGYSTTSTVVATGSTSTTTTLTATVASTLGTDTAFAPGALTFNVDGVDFSTTQQNQTSCSFAWNQAPTFSQSADAFVGSASSSDCTATGTLQDIKGFQYSVSFVGVTGLSASESTPTTLSWPVVPAPIYTTNNGDAYEFQISGASISNSPVTLNAPTITLVDTGTGQTVYNAGYEGGGAYWMWLTTSLASTSGTVVNPGTGFPCTFNDTDQTCLLGNPADTYIPNPIVATFTITIPTDSEYLQTVSVSWIGDQETITTTEHQVLASPNVEMLYW